MKLLVNQEEKMAVCGGFITKSDVTAFGVLITVAGVLVGCSIGAAGMYWMMSEKSEQERT